MDRYRHYEIARQLGEGKNGPAFLAVDTGYQQAVVVKRLDHESITSDESLDRLRKRLGLLATIDDDRLTRVYSLEEEGGRWWMVREYIDGRSLGEYVADDLPTPSRILDITLDLALQLKALHDRDLAHGNITPFNVIVGPDGKTRLVDGGLDFPGEVWARTPQAPPGEMACLAPELFSGGVINRQTDHYALGALVYLMWTGHPVYPDDDPESMIRSITQEPISYEVHPSRELSGVARLLIGKLLAKDPEDRFVSADELIFTLQGIINLASAPEPPSPKPHWRPPPRLYLLISVLAMLLVILWLVITGDRP